MRENGMPVPLRYITGYPPHLLDQVRTLITQGRLSSVLVRRYPDPHQIRSDGALRDYVAS